MGISGIPNGITGRPDLAAMRRQMVERMQKSDTDGDGSVSKDELAQGLQKPRSSGAEAAARGPGVDQVFAAGDANGDSLLSTEELTQLAASLAPPTGARGAGKPSGPPPGPPPPESGGAEGNTSTPSTPSTTERADTDRDGKVTTREQLGYELRRLLEAYHKAEAEAATSKLDTTA